MALGLFPLWALVLSATNPPPAPVATPAEVAEEASPVAVAEAPTPVEPPAASTPTPEPPRPLATPIAVFDLPSTPEPLNTPAPADQRYAFLLLGYGGGAHDGGYLTDSIMVVIVDPAQKALTLLSVPRDTWVPMSFDGKTTFYHKVNTAYAFAKDESLYPNRKPEYTGTKGAGTFVSDTLSRVLGVPIKYYVALDFAGFRQAVDAVGGIDLDVPRGFASLYPANDNPQIDPSWTTIRFKSGMQHLGGERAIQYARAREIIDDSGENGDFARSRRQRLIIEAFKTRLMQPSGLVRLPQLLTIAAKHVDTNYDVPGGAQLGQLLLDWEDVEFRQTALTLTNFLEEGTGPEGMYLLVPSMPDRSWTQVRAFVRRLWNDPATGVAAADTPITVVNSTGVSGLAGRLGDALARLGYRVAPPASGPLRPSSRLIDRTGAGAISGLARALEKDLGAEVVDAFEPPATADATGLVLELGADDTDLADLKVPKDDGAPTSAAGVKAFGGWVPEPEPTATPVPVVATPTRFVVWATAVASPAAGATGTAVRAAAPTRSAAVTPRAASTPVAQATRTTVVSTPRAIAPPATPTPAPPAKAADRGKPDKEKKT